MYRYGPGWAVPGVDGAATVQQLLYINGQANDMLEIIEAECAGSS